MTNTMTRLVRDVMTDNPICLTPDATLCEAAERMAESDIGDVLIVDDDGLRGILTDRDIVIRGLARHLDPEESTVEEILSDEVITIEPGDTIERAITLMRENALRRLPVCDGDEPIGMVSIGDLAQTRDPRSALADISSARPSR